MGAKTLNVVVGLDEPTALAAALAALAVKAAAADGWIIHLAAWKATALFPLSKSISTINQFEGCVCRSLTRQSSLVQRQQRSHCELLALQPFHRRQSSSPDELLVCQNAIKRSAVAAPRWFCVFVCVCALLDRPSICTALRTHTANQSIYSDWPPNESVYALLLSSERRYLPGSLSH